MPHTYQHQRKIARILTTVDNIIEKTEAANAKYEAIKQGMMHDLFTRGIDMKTGKLRPAFDDAPELYKESELGMIPQEWEVDELGNICEVTSSKRIYMNEYVGFGVPFYRSLEIILKSKNIDIKQTLFITAERYRMIEKQFGVPKVGDILITAVGTLGIFYRINSKERFYFKDGNLIWFRKFIDTDYSMFLRDTLDNLIRLQFDKITIGTSQKAFTIEKLKRLIIYKPHKKEYQKISYRINILRNKLHTEQKALDKYQKLKQGLMQDLLTGIKEVTPDPEDFDSEQRTVNSE